MNEPSKPQFVPAIQASGAGFKTNPTLDTGGGLADPRRFGGHSSPEDDEIDLLQLFGVLWRGKYIITLCALLAVFAGGYYAFEVAVPKYSTTARLALQARDQQVVDLESVISGVSTEQAAINTELEVIRSRGLLERLATEMNLVKDPEFNASLREVSPFSRGEIIKTISELLSLPAVEEEEPTSEEIRIKVANELLDAVAVSSQRNTYLFDIRVTTTGSEKSADLANRLAEIYLDDQIQIKFAATEYAVDWLSGRVTELELDLKQKEDAIKDLRAETELVSIEALEALNLRAKDIRERLSEAQVGAVLANQKADMLSKLEEVRDIDAILADTNDAALMRLGESAKDGDQEAASAFFARLGALVQRERADANRRAGQRDALQASYDSLLVEIDAQNADLVQLNQLVREADATRVLYETFLTRLKETSVQIGLQQADSRILSRAIPGEQVAPRKSLILALSLILGAMLGIGIVLLREFMRDGFRTAEDLEATTGYTVLGQIPNMPIRRRIALIEYLKNKPTSAVAEAIRNLRTSVLLSNIDTPPQVIMSTSSISGEGKTTQAISLTHNLSGLGKKVLLIECDIRRRTLSEYIDQKPPGDIVGVLSGDISLQNAVITRDQLGADVLMAARSKVNAADLFSSDKFQALMQEVRASYDFVILDTPPVLVVPDARILARHCDAVVYSVGWDKTGKSLVSDGLRQFSIVGVKVTGLILSQVDAKRMKRYGYGGKYGSYAQYGRGYYEA